MVTKDKAVELIRRAVVAGLDGTEFLAAFRVEEVAAAYNGIGPEYLPADVRGKVTERLAVFEPAALIHDLRNDRSDGTRHGFNYANYEFLANCRKLADRAYPWWNWRRYRARAIARAMYDFVRSSFGWRAWMDCAEKNNNKTNKE